MPSRSAVLSSSALAIEDPSSEVGKRSRLDGLSGNRAKRVVGLVLGVTAVSLLDLLLTMREAERSCFVEANPVAAAVLDGSVVSPGLFKGVLLFAGMVTLFALRRRRSVEIGCWLLLAVHVGLLARWAQYYVEVGKIDPSIHFDGQGYAWTDPAPGPRPWMAQAAPDAPQEGTEWVDRSLAEREPVPCGQWGTPRSRGLHAAVSAQANPPDRASRRPAALADREALIIVTLSALTPSEGQSRAVTMVVPSGSPGGAFGVSLSQGVLCPLISVLSASPEARFEEGAMIGFPPPEI